MSRLPPFHDYRVAFVALNAGLISVALFYALRYMQIRWSYYFKVPGNSGRRSLVPRDDLDG